MPGARNVGVVQGKGEVVGGGTGWSDRIQLHQKSQLLFVIFVGSIYGYDVATGAMTMSFKDLHAMPITCMLYLPDSDTLITTTSDSSATVGGGVPGRWACTLNVAQGASSVCQCV